ncbi:MAG: TrkA family potassium uptake protein [Eubacteriales bacterium]|nr:TrkA family potassium uptake protein [Eubacteriales bacterium]
MKDKSFAVIGLGQFGMTLAATLAQADCDVLVIDDKEENIQEIAEKVTYAVKADVREPGILKQLGVQDVDVAVIAVSENIEASISATMQAKDLGVPYVMSKAMNSLHGRILSKIGADEVIYPEKSMGLRVAKNLMAGGFLDIFELSSEISIAEFKIPESWVGRSLSSLGIREKHKINIIGIKRGDEVQVDLKPDEELPAGCTLIAVGKNRDLDENPAFRSK